VEYELDKLGGPIGHCHCRTCRKSNAAAFVSTAWVSRDHFRWIRGRDRLSSFESSPGKLRHFCSICGSQVVAERPGQPHLILRNRDAR
jgi:ADP-ribosyl-[dinitrogen reductase] hydrolase